VGGGEAQTKFEWFHEKLKEIESYKEFYIG
jgi:hypothetical protein